ncbi:MAG: hypothetical protein HY423_03205 [Candidatus Lambdaproteobacteria bacterium]|nr:hypothetical protein [Candidatus Lambdaproteobacteria bacterium]
MRYTTLRVTERGVALRSLHRRRLGAGDGWRREVFEAFLRNAAPGTYAVWLDAQGLGWRPREGSLLNEGTPVRLLVSPCADRHERFPKPRPPSAYDAVRAPGVATLLTSADGGEMLESCVAAVLGWDGARFLHPPDDRPRVWSIAETAVRENLPVRAVPLLVAAELSLVLINAVKGPCQVALPGRPPMPQDALDRLARLFADLTE